MDNEINDYIRKNINDFKARRMLKSGIRRYNENVHIKFVDRCISRHHCRIWHNERKVLFIDQNLYLIYERLVA